MPSPVRFDPADIALHLPRGGRVLIAGASGESLLLADAVMAAGEGLAAMTFTGAIVPGTNHHTYLANPQCRVETFFITPALKAASKGVDFLPLCYNDVLDRLRTIQIDAALMMVTPPDADGMCSFGPAVDFMAELWPRIPVRIAHINPLMPRTRGYPGIPFDQITAFVEGDQPFTGAVDVGDDPIANATAIHIAPYVHDGATLQMGIGKVPGAVFRALTGRRNLKVFSGLISDGVVDLEEAGALAPGVSVTAGVAIGSERLYRAIGGAAYEFQPVSVTHNPHLIAAIPDFVSINSALEIDLLGQGYAELGPKGLMSGPGGASDYARAVKIGKGTRIIALAATAAKGSINRIILPGGSVGPVSLSRMDMDVIVTEFGAADLRGLGYGGKAAALIAIAAPHHREALEQGWADYAAKLRVL